jgi:anti-sigma factor RsiW
MKMTEEMFEVLIGKYLDGEITPSEERLLEAELDRNPKAAGLLEQFQNLHQRSREVLACELLEKGKSPHDIFDKALQKSKHARHHIIKLSGWTRFVSGAAAGLIFGLVLHFTLLQMLPEKNENPANPAPVAKRIDEKMLLGTPQIPSAPSAEPTRNVDWYNFTDEQGNQWMIEGLRENFVRPAVYQKGL